MLKFRHGVSLIKLPTLPALLGTLLCALLGTQANAAGANGLHEALRATLNNHPAVAGQQAQVDAMRSTANGARSLRYPTLSAQAQQYAQGGRSSVTGEDLSRPTILSIRQPIYSFGRIKNTIAVANAEVNIERADLLNLRRQLLEATAVAYAQVRSGAQMVEIARQNVAEHQLLFTQIQRRVEGQLASSADQRLAATRLAQAKGQLERVINELEGGQQDLLRLTQVDVDTAAPVTAALLQFSESKALLDEAVEQSAEVYLKLQQLGQAEAEIDRAKTSSRPTIYLQADKFHDQPALVDDNQLSVVFEASLDGLGFASRSRTNSALASRRAALQDLAATRMHIKHELKRLQRNRRLQSELMQLQTQSLVDLDALQRSYQRQYDSGSKSWLDLMNIQRELFEQKRQLVQAKSEWITHSLRLQAKSGGLDHLADVDETSDG